MKDWLVKQGFIESEDKPIKQEPKTPQPVVTAPILTTTKQVAVDQDLVTKILKKIDVHKGYSFVEFFDSNQSSSDIKSGVKTFCDMSGTTPEAFKQQGQEVLAALEDFKNQTVNTLNAELTAKIQDAELRRTTLSTRLSELEKEILEVKAEMAKIDVSTETAETQDKAAKVQFAANYLRNNITDFINKI